MKEFAVKVENEEQYKELMRACEENGYMWRSGLEPFDKSYCLFPYFIRFDGSVISYDSYYEHCSYNRTKGWIYKTIPFHLAMSYIYGDYKYHYGARVWTEDCGWGKIIAKSNEENPCYLIDFDEPRYELHDGFITSFLWGHRSSRDSCWYYYNYELTFSAPEEPKRVKLKTGETLIEYKIDIPPEKINESMKHWEDSRIFFSTPATLETPKLHVKFWEPRETTINDDSKLMLDCIPTEKDKCYTAIRNHNTVIVILDNGRKGFAVCSPRDEFDFQKGFEIAYKRAVRL